jgi:hypothetical protein
LGGPGVAEIQCHVGATRELSPLSAKQGEARDPLSGPAAFPLRYPIFSLAQIKIKNLEEPQHRRARATRYTFKVKITHPESIELWAD